MRVVSRIALCGIVTLAVPAAANAQVALAVKGGISFGTLSNKSPDWDSRTGFAIGVALDPGKSPIGIQPEALYVQKGVNFNGSPASSSDAPQLSYIDVPILLKITVPTTGVQPTFVAGPSIMFNLTCSFAGFDCKDFVNNVDYGVVLGAGLRFGETRAFSIEGRYTWGLKDINDPGEGVKQQTRTFLILAGVSF